MTLGTLRRNDLASVRVYYEQRGRLRSDEFRSLLKLQDDPNELLAIAEREDWKIENAPGPGVAPFPESAE